MSDSREFTTGSIELAGLGRLQRRSLLVGVVALAACLVGALFGHQQFVRSYLVAYVFWIGIALGCLAILMLQHLSGGAWGLVIRRLLESASCTLWLMALLFLPILAGVRSLYPWSRPEEVAASHLLQHKAGYLNVGFFGLRALIYFALWIGVSHLLNRWSLRQDRDGGPEWTRRMQLLSGPGLALFVLSVTFASIDWVMSLRPEWYSTMFGFLFVGGQALSALAFTIVCIALLADRKPLADVLSADHFHDLGKLLLAFVMLWTYFSFSQFLIIWSGNLPEETPWYLARLRGGWGWVAMLILLFHFALPFALLLSRDIKRHSRRLAQVAALVVVMRFIDVLWLIVPEFQHGRLSLHWMDLAAPIGMGGIWVAFFTWQLQRRPLLPLGAGVRVQGSGVRT